MQVFLGYPLLTLERLGNQTYVQILKVGLVCVIRLTLVQNIYLRLEYGLGLFITNPNYGFLQHRLLLPEGMHVVERDLNLRQMPHSLSEARTPMMSISHHFRLESKIL